MLDDAPELLPEAAYYLNAFEHLSTSRDRVEANQPIKITEIKSYCEIVGEPEPLEFMDIIKTLDKLFIRFFNK